MVPLSDESLWWKHLKQYLLNFIHIRELLLKEPIILVDFINNMIVCVHEFEILKVQLVPLIGTFRKDNCFFLFILLPQRIPHHLWIFFFNIYSDFMSRWIWFLNMYKVPNSTMSVIGRAPTTGAAKHWTSPRVDNLTLMSVAHQGKWCPSRVRNSNSLMTISPTILDAKYIWFGNLQNASCMWIQQTWNPAIYSQCEFNKLEFQHNSQCEFNILEFQYKFSTELE